MQKLHLVGFTTDHRGLIFSVRRGAKSGGYVVPVDDALLLAFEELRELLLEEQAAQAEAASPSKATESSLSVREVQARLRRGRTIDQVAREAGVDAAWVARFAVPILAEQAEVIRAARATRMTKQRIGLSGAPLGDAVYRNLAERGVTDPRDELDRGWRARQLTDGVWLVSFTYAGRGVEREAVWEYDEVEGSLRSRGRTGTQLGFREPARRPPSTTKTEARPKVSPKASDGRASTARRSTSRQAAKKVGVARRAAAARMVSDAEKATRRNAALARKAATKPVVIPPRRIVEPPPPEPLLVDEPVEPPNGWRGDLQLSWNETLVEEIEHIPEVQVDDERAVDVGADEIDIEIEDDVTEAEVVVDVDHAVDHDHDSFEAERLPVPPVPPPPPRRRKPLRARSQPPPSAVEPVSRVRIRFTDRSGAGESANGPTFRSDLRSAADLDSFVVDDEPLPVAPLVAPPPPVEPVRRRRRPLRGR